MLPAVIGEGSSDKGLLQTINSFLVKDTLFIVTDSWDINIDSYKVLIQWPVCW